MPVSCLLRLGTWPDRADVAGLLIPAREALMSDSNRPTGNDSGNRAELPIDANLRAGLALLSQAHLYGLDAGAVPWDFALENEYLYETELTISDLRWLVAK